MRQDSIPSSGY